MSIFNHANVLVAPRLESYLRWIIVTPRHASRASFGAPARDQ
jgi:hypothetical protein